MNGHAHYRDRSGGNIAWQLQAACRGLDAELWYPEKGANGDVATAVAVCRACPVVQACFDHAQEHMETLGIRGGMTPMQRRAARRSQRGART